jgi:hypothetical protein
MYKFEEKNPKTGQNHQSFKKCKIDAKNTGVIKIKVGKKEVS